MGIIANLISGFDVTPAFGVKRVRVMKRREQMHTDVAAWLFREVYI